MAWKIVRRWVTVVTAVRGFQLPVQLNRRSRRTSITYPQDVTCCSVLLRRPRIKDENNSEALTLFLDHLWDCCIHLPDVYKIVVSTYTNWTQVEDLDPDSVQEICRILSGFPSLLKELSALLPEDKTFKVPDDFAWARAVEIISSGSAQWRAAFGLSDDATSPIQTSTDEKIKYLLRSAFAERVREEAVVTLREGDARRTVEILHQIVNNRDNLTQFALSVSQTPSVHQEIEKWLNRLLVKLAVSSNRMPPSFHLTPESIQVPRDCQTCGSFANIYKGTATIKGHIQTVAIKHFRVYYQHGSRPDLEEVLILKEMLCNETLIWAHLEHRHVLEFLGVCDMSQTPNGLPFGIVMPWVERGNIRQYIRDLDSKNVAVNILRWLPQIAEGLAYLHAKGVVHGDLKGVNILVDDDENVKLTDFGLSMLLQAVSSQAKVASKGTARWAAPELSRSDSPVDSTASIVDYQRIPKDALCRVDIYSFACTVVELYGRRDPQFSGISRMAPDHLISAKVVKGHRPQRPTEDGRRIPDSVWVLVNSCWNDDATARPSASSVLNEIQRLYEQYSSEPE